MKAKTLISMTIAAIMSLSIGTSAFAGNASQVMGDNNVVVFNDVPHDHWARDQIEYFARIGIISGYEDGTFRPEDGVTREEFCKLLVSTFQQSVNSPKNQTFSDVAADRWSYPYVEFCKDFLTGYANPFGGSPMFHPEEYAMREDIAVALVRMMGYSSNDASNKNYALNNFIDGSAIAPSLLPYVSLACERNLISGYPDGTFKPAKGITRAETVALLNRATKQAVTDFDTELDLSADVSYSNYGKTATIKIVAEEGTAVTVNGETVKMENNNNGKYVGNYVYNFDDEGTMNFMVKGTHMGKTRTVNVTAKYEIGVPIITITECPESSNSDTAKISGSVKDSNGSELTLTINGKTVYLGYNGTWQETINLREGNNKVVLVATNEEGKSTTETRSIKYSIAAPKLTITQCPETSTESKISIRGIVKDKNDSNPTVTINGNSVSVNYDGSWSGTVYLSEGNNRITVVATNNLGKSTAKSENVVFDVGAPQLTVKECPKSTSKESVTIKGTVLDTNDSDPKVTVNGSPVYADYSGAWSETVYLKEGDNLISIVATNSSGKSTVVEKNITFEIGGPEIFFVNCPETITKDEVTVKGRIEGENKSAMLFVNDEEVSVSGNNEFKLQFDLKEGENKYVFRAVNYYGKEMTVTKTITYTPNQPSAEPSTEPSDDEGE